VDQHIIFLGVDKQVVFYDYFTREELRTSRFTAPLVDLLHRNEEECFMATLLGELYLVNKCEDHLESKLISKQNKFTKNIVITSNNLLNLRLFF
jgi:hypothetical protein